MSLPFITKARVSLLSSPFLVEAIFSYLATPTIFLYCCHREAVNKNISTIYTLIGAILDERKSILQKARVLNSKSEFSLIRTNVDIPMREFRFIMQNDDFFSFFHYNVIQAIFGLKVSGVVFESLYTYNSYNFEL